MKTLQRWRTEVAVRSWGKGGLWAGRGQSIKNSLGEVLCGDRTFLYHDCSDVYIILYRAQDDMELKKQTKNEHTKK